MTRERARELLPVIQAWAEGKEIQAYMGCGHWMDVETPVFGDATKWRVKPQPREFWLVGSKIDRALPWQVWSEKPKDFIISEVIHVKEVV